MFVASELEECRLTTIRISRADSVERHPTLSLFPEDEYGDEMESPSWLADPTASIQETVEQTEFSMDIYRLLDELPDVYRTVLTLIDLYQLDYSEAAKQVSIAP